MRHTGVVTHTAAGVLLASVLLTGCGGGSDSDSASKQAGSPTEAEWTAAYATYTDVGDAFNAAIGGATAYQAAYAKVHDTSPRCRSLRPVGRGRPGGPAGAGRDAGRPDRSAGRRARDDAIAELKEAYDAFATAAEEMNTFQDGYNESMPVLLRSLDICPDIFSIEVPKTALVTIPGVYSELWIKRHNQAAAPCRPAARTSSTTPANYRIRQYAANWRKVIDQRTDLMADVENTQAGFDQTIARLKRINGAFTKRNEQADAVLRRAGEGQRGRGVPGTRRDLRGERSEAGVGIALDVTVELTSHRGHGARRRQG